MEKFSAEQFFDLASILQALRSANVGNQNLEHESQVFIWLGTVRLRLDAVGLAMSSKHVSRILDLIRDKAVPGKTFQEVMLPELANRIHDEMEDQLFMYVPPERAKLYNQQELFGKEVNAKFSTVQFDMVEAGNCYAAGRSTATVFHLMRIMEVGVQAFGGKLGVSLVNEKNWQNVLDEINKKIKALPPKDLNTIEMSQASANLYAVKLAWRNEVMHPKDTYTLEEADNLIRQVRIFMQQLATVV